MSIEENIESLRQEVRAVADKADALVSGGMRFKTVLMLLSHHTGLPQKTIRKVIESIDEIDEAYFHDGEESL